MLSHVAYPVNTMTATCAAPAIPRPAVPAATGRPAVVAPDLGALHGPAAGMAELPLTLLWSLPGQKRAFDVGDPDRRRRMYEIVVQAARRPEDLAAWLDGPLLIASWPALRLTRR